MIAQITATGGFLPARHCSSCHFTRSQWRLYTTQSSQLVNALRHVQHLSNRNQANLFGKFGREPSQQLLGNHSIFVPSHLVAGHSQHFQYETTKTSQQLSTRRNTAGKLKISLIIQLSFIFYRYLVCVSGSLLTRLLPKLRQWIQSTCKAGLGRLLWQSSCSMRKHKTSTIMLQSWLIMWVASVLVESCTWSFPSLSRDDVPWALLSDYSHDYRLWVTLPPSPSPFLVSFTPVLLAWEECFVFLFLLSVFWLSLASSQNLLGRVCKHFISFCVFMCFVFISFASWSGRIMLLSVWVIMFVQRLSTSLLSLQILHQINLLLMLVVQAWPKMRWLICWRKHPVSSPSENPAAFGCDCHLSDFHMLAVLREFSGISGSLRYWCVCARMCVIFAWLQVVIHGTTLLSACWAWLMSGGSFSLWLSNHMRGMWVL